MNAYKNETPLAGGAFETFKKIRGESEAIMTDNQLRVNDLDLKRHEVGAANARQIWESAAPANPEHPYLLRKNIPPFGLRQVDETLLIPIMDGDAITSLQKINDEGKRFAKDGRVGGCFYVVDRVQNLPIEKAIISEGMADSHTLAGAFENALCIAALSAGNLVKTAEALRKKYPDIPIIAAGDNDLNEVGRTAANEAAAAVGGAVAIPAKLKDWNDVFSSLIEEGFEENLIEVFTSEFESSIIEVARATVENKPEVILTNGLSVKIERVRWLWEGFLALGKLTLLAGAPGSGKTTCSMQLAATISSGGRLPCGAKTEARDVVIWSGEDSPSDTLMPRFLASGGNPTRVHFIEGVNYKNGTRSFDPSSDMTALKAALSKIKPGLLIVDPIVSAVAGDSHKNTEVRRGLQPVVDLCMALDCALLGITHLSKGTQGRDPTERVTGSLAFAALARIVILCAKPESAPGENAKRLFIRSKSNIGSDSGGFEYELSSEYVPGHAGLFASVCSWGNAVETSAREALDVADNPEGISDGAIDEAIDFLRNELADDEKKSDEIFKLARAQGISKSTLKRAKAQLEIKAKRNQNAWWWVLPKLKSTNQGDQGDQGDQPLKVEPLGPLEVKIVPSSLISSKSEIQGDQVKNVEPLEFQREVVIL